MRLSLRSLASVARLVAAALVAAALAGATSPACAQPLWSIRADADDAPVSDPGAVLLRGMDTFVYDRDAGRIVRLDRAGKAVQRIGAKGAGPGEFQGVAWLGFGVNDSLYVWDDRQRRLSVFAANGRYVRSESPEHGAERPAVFGRLRDGRWLTVTETDSSRRVGGVDVSQAMLRVGVARTVREAPTTMTTVPSKVSVAVRTPSGMFDMREVPGAEMSYLASCENGFLVGAGAAREVRAYDAKGTPLTTVRPRRAAQRFSGAARQSLIENWAGVHKGKGPPADPATAAAFVKAFDAILPKEAPGTAQFVFGTDRSVWLAPDAPGLDWQRVGDDGAGRPQLGIGGNPFLVAASADHVVVKFYGDDERLEMWPRPAALRGAFTPLPASLGRCSGALVR